MKSTWLPALFLVPVLALLPSSVGCGGGDKAATPQQMEKHRQQQIERSARERREG